MDVIVIRFVLNCIINLSLSCIFNFLVLYYECLQCVPVCFRADFTEYEYEYEIFIALISQRNIRVQGSTSIKIYGYQHTTNKLKH